MAQHNLGRIYSRFSVRTNILVRDFLVAPPSPSLMVGETPVQHLIDYSRKFLINRLLHLWGEFCKSLVVSSALGGCITIGGKPVSSAPRVSSLSDISVAIKGPLDGPGKIGKIQNGQQKKLISFSLPISIKSS